MAPSVSIGTASLQMCQLMVVPRLVAADDHSKGYSISS
jgi:hypothetical protein